MNKIFFSNTSTKTIPMVRLFCHIGQRGTRWYPHRIVISDSDYQRLCTAAGACFMTARSVMVDTEERATHTIGEQDGEFYWEVVQVEETGVIEKVESNPPVDGMQLALSI